MKISNRTHAPLRYLEQGNLKDCNFLKDDRDFFNKKAHSVNNTFEKYFVFFNSDISFISLEFMDAGYKARNKLHEVVNDNNDFFINGTFITAYGVTMFYIDIKKSARSQVIVMFHFDRSGVLLSHKHEINNNVLENWTSKVIFQNDGKSITSDGLCNNVILYDFFRKYAEVEIKNLPPKSRIKDINCKYINDTASSINILDSKWFTTLVKSDSFKVSGHFRLQPYGEGMKQRKLIWIEDFVKTGYTAPARKLSHGK